jgi:signal transduction histidine kinase
MQAERENQQAYLRFVTGAQRGIDRLQAMLNDLLDTSRLEQGVFALNTELLNLAALVRETAGTLRTPATPIEVRGADEILLEADPNRIRQALENLIGNAVRHSPEGIPIILELEMESGTKRDLAVVAVRDAGPGIAPELLPKLFTRFGAGGNTKGLGLGLYLVRGIAEAHGGTITVDSTPGKGATSQRVSPNPPGHG